MSEKYKIRDNDKACFITMTVVGWIDVFTRTNQKRLIVNSLQYCVKNKSLVIFAWCLMSNHLHMICKVEDGQHVRPGRQSTLSDILRDFKTFTSKKIIEQIKEGPESRREWMLEYFSNACSHLKRDQKYKVWQDGNHPMELFSNSFIYEKLDYIHNNPVEDMIVEKPWEYLYSSARNYADMEGLGDVCVIGHRPLVDNWR